MANEYLRIMRERFDQKNDPLADPVPWELDDKHTAYSYAASRDWRVPRYVRSATLEEAIAAGSQFGDRFIIKQPNRHSTMGVYLLKRIADDRYLELLSLTEKSAADLAPVGRAPDYWLTEEFVPSAVAGRPIPLDYKIYAFRGHITHVVQIDRNVYPPRVAVFDGAFIPLQPGVDYTTNPDRWLLEHHVFPIYAGTMLTMASRLSSELDTRFVRVDCFDTAEGPVLGEFTFASGPDDVGMLRYSERIGAALDEAIRGGTPPPLSGFDVDAAMIAEVANKAPTLRGPVDVLAQLAGGAIQGDIRYAPAVQRYLTGDSTRAVFHLAINMIGHLNGDGRRAFGIQAGIRQRGRYITGDSRVAEFEELALDHHRRQPASSWNDARIAEILAQRGDADGTRALENLVASGYAPAVAILERVREQASR
jgi:hypothetical protein